MLPNKAIFLDLDGVLNDYQFNKVSQVATIDTWCVMALNRILEETGAKIVISSAWRYLIHRNEMSVRGFDIMLRTHGVKANSVVGFTRRDQGERADDIEDWLSRNTYVESWVVIDDEPDGMIACRDRDRLVKTDGTRGLTNSDAIRAIEILNKKAK